MLMSVDNRFNRSKGIFIMIILKQTRSAFSHCLYAGHKRGKVHQINKSIPLCPTPVSGLLCIFPMAKVHPQTFTAAPLSPPSDSCITSKREAFTIWMKSLVIQGNGCTVFNSDGEIVYRIDNYDKKCSSEVYLMDLQGKVLFTILQRKLRVFGRWEGYKSNGSKGNNQKPWFQVRKNCRILGGGSSCQVTVRPNEAQSYCYRIQGLTGKSAFKIVDSQGGLVAEVEQKQTSSGVVLGEDVLNLVVEPHVDHSLVMALVAVYGLIHHRM
ncbi:Protein LURP-one-related 4 [Vitis vinifera]|uniref:Protein LURP-one-related 4 n=1 Tax=Vitis vinifera TaxID=29760 RepID=A0A438BZH7_VITVI|nr:Protein LURP-one-related 4 [Vitis vinifera]